MFWLFTSCNSLHNQDRENFQQPRKFSHALCSQFLQPAILGNCLSDPAAAATKVTSVVSNSVWPHRWPPTTLLCPWDSPDKNTGVGCHFLLQCMKVKSEVAQSLSRSVVSDCSRPYGLQPTRLPCPWAFPGKSTGVGCHCLLHIWS